MKTTQKTNNPHRIRILTHTILVILPLVLLAASSILLISFQESLHQKESLQQALEKRLIAEQKLNQDLMKTQDGQDDWEHEKYELVSTPPENLNYPVCDYGNCLFQNDNLTTSVGIGTIKGFYTKTDRLDWDKTPVVCDSFVLTDAPSSWTTAYERDLERKVTFIQQDEQGRIVINLNFWGLDQNLVQKIKKTTEAQPISLVVFSPITLGHGAGPCESDDIILSQVK